MSEPMLKVENLNVSYGDFNAVRDVSIEIEKGEVVSVIGSNGAGKTTLMKAISGIIVESRRTPMSGKVWFSGEDITDMSAHKRVNLGLGQVPEGARVFPRMTVVENLMMGSYTSRARPKAKRNLEYVYGLFPILKEKWNDISGTLSGGQRQMVAIGRVLMSEPSLIILDELSLGLAPTVIKDIYANVRNISAEGMTIVLVEQDVKRSLKACARAYIMLKGSVVLSGDPRGWSENDVQKAYFGI
jgi:branched-chain amino acid transport system ATP-binding protein